MASPKFVKSITANLVYWCGRVDEIDDPALRGLIPESQNIYRAVEFGMALPHTWRSAAQLIVELNAFIEYSGNWQPWQVMIEQALECCGEENSLLRLRLLDLSGQFYRKQRDWESSLAAYRQEELLAEEIGSREQLAQAHWGLGTLFWRMREYNKAMRYSQQALAELRALPASERQLGGVLTNIALVEYGRGEYEAAVKAHMQAVSHFRASDYPVLLARSLVNLALAQEAAGDVEQSMESYLEVRSILDHTDYEMEKTRLELSLGTLLFNLGRLEEAEDAFTRAYSPYLKRSGLIYLLGLASNNLGIVYIEQGRFREAEMMLGRSLAYWERTNAPLQIANTKGNLAKNLAAQGRYLEAAEQYYEAIAGANAYPEDGYARAILEECQEAMAELL